MRNEKKTKNDSRIHPKQDDNNSMRNNNNTQEDTKIMFQVVQTIVRGGEWQQDIVAEFATESEAIDFAKRCHNGNPTTRVVKK